MATCANHPIKMATARCKACNKPLCNECKLVTEAGIFCSPECETKVRQFQEKVSDYTVTYKTRLLTPRAIKGLIVLAIVVAAMIGYLYFQMGIRSWPELRDLLASWWNARRLLLP